jgi:hypothetical protein
MPAARDKEDHENTKDGKHEGNGIRRLPAICCFSFRVFVRSRFRDFHDVLGKTVAIIMTVRPFARAFTVFVNNAG